MTIIINEPILVKESAEQGVNEQATQEEEGDGEVQENEEDPEDREIIHEGQREAHEFEAIEVRRSSRQRHAPRRYDDISFIM